VRPAQFAEGFQRTWVEMRSLPGTRVLAISEFVKSQMVRSGYPNRDIHVLYLPAPNVRASDMSAELTVPKARASFVFLGRLVREKGMEWLLRSLAQLGADIEVDVAGTGPERERLGGLAAQLGLGDRVRFHGWLEESKALQMIASARAVIFPSIWHEPAGLVTLEAAAAGRAVIASRVGAIPEYAGLLGNAILVSPNDLHGLASAMRRLADDPGEAQRLGEAGRRAARELLSLESHADQLDQHYAESIAAGRASAGAEGSA